MQLVGERKMKRSSFYDEFERCICAKCFEQFYRRIGSDREICIPCREGFIGDRECKH